MEKLRTLTNNIGEKIFLGFLYFAITWVILAVIFGISMTYLELAGKTETTRNIVNWIEWRIESNKILKIHPIEVDWIKLSPEGNVFQSYLKYC